MDRMGILGRVKVLVHSLPVSFSFCITRTIKFVFVFFFVNVRSLFVLYCHKNPPIAEIQKSQLEMYDISLTSQIEVSSDPVASTVTSLAISNLCCYYPSLEWIHQSSHTEVTLKYGKNQAKTFHIWQSYIYVSHYAYSTFPL
jgi:hypothetical protein